MVSAGRGTRDKSGGGSGSRSGSCCALPIAFCQPPLPEAMFPCTGLCRPATPPRRSPWEPQSWIPAEPEFPTHRCNDQTPGHRAIPKGRSRRRNLCNLRHHASHNPPWMGGAYAPSPLHFAHCHPLKWVFPVKGLSPPANRQLHQDLPELSLFLGSPPEPEFPTHRQ